MFPNEMVVARDEPGAPITVVLGYRMWQERYESDPNIAGKPIKVNGEAATILGVMEDGFMFPQDHEILVIRPDDRSETTRESSTGFNAFARLKDGVMTIEKDYHSRCNPDLVAWFCLKLIEMYEGKEMTHEPT